MLNVLALFAGIGGIEYGLSKAAARNGIKVRTVCYVERDPYCIEVIKARIRDGLLDDAPIWDDIKEFDGRPWAGCVDLVTGGFPCQDVSCAGKRKGLKGERSGLWFEMLRVIREARPPFVIVENVPGLRSKGMDRVLADLAESGFDAEWEVLPAAAFGAPHLRERLFIIAYSPKIRRAKQYSVLHQEQRDLGKSGQLDSTVYWNRVRLNRQRPETYRSFFDQPIIRRVDDGTTSWVEQLEVLGNAVVPQVSEFVGDCIIRWLLCHRPEILET